MPDSVIIFGALITIIFLSSSPAAGQLDQELDGTEFEEPLQEFPVFPNSENRRPFPRNFFSKTSWNTMPALALLRRHMSSLADKQLMEDPLSQSKRSPEPYPDDTGLTLSIMSPLDVLREKMMQNTLNRKQQQKTAKANQNADFLRKYG